MEITVVPNSIAVRDTAAAPSATDTLARPIETSARFVLPARAEVDVASTAEAESGPSPAKAFEALMVAQMVDIMLPENDAMFGEGAGASVWRSMFVDVLSTQLADDIDLGVADRIEGALKASGAEKGSL